MTMNGWLQIAIFFALVAACTVPMGALIAAVMEGKRTFLSPVIGPLERLIYRICGVKADEEQHWTRYAASLIAFSAVSAVMLYAMQRLQVWFPWNPLQLGAGNVSPDLAFNTATSFTTNTNWQSYTPEQTLSYFVEMGANGA